ncbi:unnamed protein product [Dracunculus medinensis]|uniref:Biogenesis of lysosome-related organelles complex 1 subunit KXD1 n=1 Tax=Dracunculus medinensis TaxID=318479 RepID=A0A0N4U5U6_DRAME|nr:unnamed protein product [Dracunculus medinensis]
MSDVLCALFPDLKNEPTETIDSRHEKLTRPDFLEFSVDEQANNFKSSLINTSEEKLSPVTAIDMNDQSHNEMEDDITFTPITIESDLGGDIDVMEGSLMSMLENFRSGKMTILSDEILSHMQQARKEMEELTAFHIKLHRLQVPSTSANCDIDAQYDTLFRRLDNLHSFIRNMSFGNSKNETNENNSAVFHLGEH